MVNIPTAEYLDNLRPYQLEYLQATQRFRVLMWHRGSHKTTDLLNFQISECFRTRGLYWFISPYLNQGVATVWTDPNTSIFRWLPEEIKKKLKINNSEHSIVFPSGSIWQLKGADKPDSLRGPKPIGQAVDEYGEIAKRWGSELREAILEPTAHSSNGWIHYAGTPKGNNDFEHVRQMGQDPVNTSWWSSKKTVEDTGIYTNHEMEEIKRSAVNLDFIFQEYYCAVADGASTVFKGHLKCIKGELQTPIAGHTYIFGIDLARTFDRTAIVGFDTNSNHLIFFKLLKNESWELQKKTILSILNNYNGAQAVVDATGVGDSFVEQLSLSGANVYPFKISGNAVKKNLVERLQMFLENQYLSYPNIEEVKNELNNFEYDITPSGTMTFSAPNGQHDDIVMAMALAVQVLGMTPVPFVEYTFEERVRQEMSVDERTGYIV